MRLIKSTTTIGCFGVMLAVNVLKGLPVVVVVVVVLISFVLFVIVWMWWGGVVEGLRKALLKMGKQ